MKPIKMLCCVLLLALSLSAQPAQQRQQVFILVDMEDLSSVVTGDQTTASGGKDIFNTWY